MEEREIIVDRIYRVRRSVPEYFRVARLDKKRIMGTYVGMEHLGLCPLGEEYLMEEVKLIDIADHWANVRFRKFEKLLNDQMKRLLTRTA